MTPPPDKPADPWADPWSQLRAALDAADGVMTVGLRRLTSGAWSVVIDYYPGRVQHGLADTLDGALIRALTDTP